MSKEEIYAKLRPTALIFAAMLTVLVIILIFAGIPQALMSGSESSVNMLYLIIGTGIGGLIGPLTKLCEDSPPAPPAQVPETTVLGLLDFLQNGMEDDSDA